MTTTDRRDALRAGRLVLAVADDDKEQAVAIMHETMTEPGPGIVGLMVAVCQMAAGYAEGATGPGWKSGLVHGLNALEFGADDGCGAE
jgi:hypothetical protein